MQPESLVGATLDGRYEVTRTIGGGGMGYVYEAQHVGTGRRVAIKLISTDDLTKNPGLVSRFQREAKAAGAIDTQHICQVLDTGVDPGSGLPFMVMEYMQGEDVQQLYQRVGTIGPEVALKIVAQACLGMQKAHDAGVVHRDIKPANLFLAKKDGGEVMVKLLDFGIAKVKMEQASSMENAALTRTGSILGSPLYMSPEQARGSKGIDHRADLWSLGVVLYQGLCGRTPWHHIEALGELILSICHDPPRPVQDFAPWVSPEIARIVHKALKANPAERYQSAQEMYDDCKALLPMGTTIEEAMLVSLSDTHREQVAKRITLPPPAPAGAQSMVGSSPSLPPGALQAGTAGTTEGISAPTERRPTAGKSNTPLLVVGALIGVIGAGTFAALKLTGGDAGAGAATSVVATPPPPPPTVTATAAATVTQAPDVTPAPSERSVKLVIIPENAEVEVDGKPAKVKDGIVEIRGGQGSHHKVKLKSGKFELEEDVYITEQGATPPKVELDIKTGLKVPIPKTTATPAGPAAPTAPPKGIEEKFE